MKKNTVKLEEYMDIIHLPHHVSEKRPQMAIINRAAQFAPFAAVVGYDDSVSEAARLTDQRRELDEMEKVLIDEKLRMVEDKLPEKTMVEIEYFREDERKAGGQYVTKVGCIKKIDVYLREIVMEDDLRIYIEDVYKIS